MRNYLKIVSEFKKISFSYFRKMDLALRKLRKYFLILRKTFLKLKYFLF